MKKLIVVLAAVLVMPLQAEAAPNTVDCAVGYTGNDYQRVVLSFGSGETRQNVADTGASCSELISTDLWIGVDKYVDWQEFGFQRLCFVQLSNNESVVVYSAREYDSRVLGFEMCLAGNQQYVHYYPWE